MIFRSSEDFVTSVVVSCFVSAVGVAVVAVAFVSVAVSVSRACTG